MVLWFVGLSWLIVYLVFQSPALDYRMVMLGSVLPLLDGFTGGAWVLHTLVGAVLALALVMAFTTRRRLVRRRWLGIPIGMFAHLLLDGVWAITAVFWWPFFGWSFAGQDLPEAGRGAAGLLMDVVGLGALVYGYRRFQLDDATNRSRFLTTGQLPR